VTTPRPGDVLRALAGAQTEAWPMQGQYQQQQQQQPTGNLYLQSCANSRSEAQIIAEETARTCAYSFSRALLAVADLFDSAASVPPEQQR
jgi:hypothetical protein